MAAHYDSGSEDEFHSWCLRDRHDGPAHGDDDSDSPLNMGPPVHPIAALQGAFEESIYESTHSEDDSSPEYPCDAEMRRRQLLDVQRYEDVRQAKWKQKDGAQYHPLLKLVAQIVFGMHLLQNSQARSNDEVVKILQNHVNDVDSFLECTSEDFELATTDIQERTRYLKLPMEHMAVFNAMLDEQQFRTDLVNGNDKIDMIVERTARAMNDALYDISSGLEATKELGTYLSGVEREGLLRHSEIAEVFSAMRGNEQGWMQYLRDLRIKGENLGKSLVALEIVIADINKHAAAAGERNQPRSRAISLTATNHSGCASGVLRSKFAKDAMVHRKPRPRLDKPLPSAPEGNAHADEVLLGKPHPVSFATRYEQPRQHAPTPASRKSSNAEQANTSHRRRTSRMLSGPLSSNPPDTPTSPRVPYKTPGPSQSQIMAQILRASSPQRPSASFRRSTQMRYVPANDVTPVKDPISITTGFSRRISKRLRSIPPLLQSRSGNERRLTQEPIARPIDSAYSSDRKRSTSSPTEFTVDMDYEIEKDRPTELEEDPIAISGIHKSGSRLGLFPKDTGPLTPSQASIQSRQSRHDTPNEKSVSVFSDPSTKPSSKTSRTLSIRKFFRNHKNERQDVAT